MNTLIATFALATIVATSAVAVAQPGSGDRAKEAHFSTEYASPNAAYVAPPAAPGRIGPVLPFTWTEKRAFDRASASCSC